jgi:Tfp pilus assembly protein PilF
MSDLLRKMSAEEFSRRVKMMCEHPDSRFALFLGSGCSVSSGIPAASSLVKSLWLPRLRDLRDPSREDLEKWAQEEIPDYDPKNPAAAYGAVIEKLFLLPEERQREIERLCDGKFPGFGYAVLAQLMTLEAARFNVALTTNFDNLVAEALYLFTAVQPVVVPHESLGNYLRPTRTRPLVVKLHGDHHLGPLNTARTTAEVKADVEKRVRAVIRDRGLIFLGYGGNDQGIAQILSAFTEEALPLGVYWVSDEDPQGIIRSWLESRQAIWVQKGDFDECMLLLRNAFALPHPDSKRFEHVFAQYTAAYQTLSTRIGGMEESAPGAGALKEAIAQTDQSFPDWWAVELEAERLKHTDPTKADAIYAKGLEQYPQSGALLNSYANFLRDYRKDNVRAEDFYQKALAIDPDNVEILQHYAFFLARIRKDYDRAEELYNRALTVDPANSRLVATYASFLAKMRRDPKRAEECYHKALGSANGDPYIQASYAGFLLAQGREEEGLNALTKVLPQSAGDETPNLALETWFYLLAHGPADRRVQTLTDLKRALKAGRRRSGLILAPNILKARQSGHPDTPWLEKLAAVITDEANQNVLDDWQAWKAA